MNLEFLGIGQAFSLDFDNNAAYFIENKTLFLIDCGETVFTNIKKNNLLEDINDVYIFITHTHSDHIGSIGSLIFYLYIIKNIKAKIILSNLQELSDAIIAIIGAFGIKSHKYLTIQVEELDNKFNSFKNIRYIKQTHFEDMVCSGLIFDTEEGIVYYSGDSNDVNVLEEVIKKENIDKMFIEATNQEFKDNPHLSLSKLNKIIPKNMKEHTYLMHLNNKACIKEAKDLGFKVVKSVI